MSLTHNARNTQQRVQAYFGTDIKESQRSEELRRQPH